MVPACNETSNKKNNAMFYYMPSQLLLVETEVIVLSYSRN